LPCEPTWESNPPISALLIDTFEVVEYDQTEGL
jgi:hypothetical protein